MVLEIIMEVGGVIFSYSIKLLVARDVGGMQKYSYQIWTVSNQRPLRPTSLMAQQPPSEADSHSFGL